MHVLQLRGGLPEANHGLSFALVGPGGALRTGGAPASTFWRSASKPFQLEVALSLLPDDGAALGPEELALAASSHSGQPGHLAVLDAILNKFGLEEAALRCGAEPPAHAPSAAALIAAGAPPRAAHNDCSGKHALMLAACAARGWDSQTYLAPEHPLQRQIAALIHARTAEPAPVAVDGCGVPTFWVSLSGMARAWQQLAAAMAAPATEPRLAHIGAAMAAHPWLVSGDDRLDLALANRAAEPFVGKIGALGVFCVALPARGLGLAVKVHSGDEGALGAAVPALLDRLAPGALRPAVGWRWSEVRNVVGRIVGQRLVAGLPRA
ncbi:MAG: asparaginase [Deltaproteobacteria bacterium]|nr:asparaginase [Deltaproteobacteria bacterium]